MRLVDANSADRLWFRSSLGFLAALCRGRNLLSQRAVSRLVPAELLLALLFSPQVDTVDKHIACDLLCCIFLENDLVFPIKTRLPQEVLFIGIDQGIPRHDALMVTAGKVFNAYSRAKITAGYCDGPSLRRQLRMFMSREVRGMVVSHDDSDAKLLYDACLLQLLSELLLQGFFDLGMEGEGGKVEAQGEDQVVVGDAGCAGRWFRSKQPQEPAFDHAAIEALLVAKLHDFLDSLTRHAAARRAGLEGSGAAGSQRISEEAGVAAVNARFNGVFGSELRIKVVTQLVACLTVLYDAQQMAALEKLTLELLRINRRFSDPTVGLAESMEAGDEESHQDSAVPLLSRSSAELIRRTVAEKDAVDRGYVKAVLHATLFPDLQLQHKVYSLLHRQMFPRIDAKHMLSMASPAQLSSRARRASNPTPHPFSRQRTCSWCRVRRRPR